jgi:short-subunit dehydrogenase
MPRRDETALVTGASYGIGATMAKALAARGYDLILTARSGKLLEALAAELRASRGVEVSTIVADLARHDGPRGLIAAVAELGRPVDLLINNAGFGSGGDFTRLAIANELEMIDLNVRALVELTHAFLLQMRERGRGAIVNVASLASFQPVPYMTTYAATKAFVYSFSVGLWRENRRHGVHVMALCPGPTESRFFERAKLTPRAGAVSQTSEAVVQECLRALDRRRPYVVTGIHNRLLLAIERVVPRTVVVGLAARSMKRRA